MSQDVRWFRRPTGQEPSTGTLNPVYDLLDRRVVHGGAGDVVVSDLPHGTAAELVEQVAGLAGALRGLGATVGAHVLVDLADAGADVLTRLALLRLGAVSQEPDPVLAVVEADRVGSVSAAQVVAHGTEESVDPRVFPWALALRAGLTDPAPVVPLPGTPELLRLARTLSEDRVWTCAELLQVL